VLVREFRLRGSVGGRLVTAVPTGCTSGSAGCRRAALRRLWQIKYDRSIDDRAMGGEIRIQFSGTANLDILVNFGHAPARADGP
jgi:hypothetical protein